MDWWDQTVEAFGLSEKGLREENQDTFYFNSETGIFIIADGMGGHSAGQVASSIAVNSAKNHFAKFNTINTDEKEMIIDAIQEANQKIFRYATVHPDAKGMGTTMTLMYIKKNIAYLGHIGDSRAYHIKSDQIKQLTNDHSYVGELLRSGGLSEDEAFNHPQRNLLTRALGSSGDVEIDVIQQELNLNEYILLCTDGLFSMVNNKEIKDIVLNYNISEAVEVMINLALKRGGNDNITAVLIKKM